MDGLLSIKPNRKVILILVKELAYFMLILQKD